MHFFKENQIVLIKNLIAGKKAKQKEYASFHLRKEANMYFFLGHIIVEYQILQSMITLQ